MALNPDAITLTVETERVDPAAYSACVAQLESLSQPLSLRRLTEVRAQAALSAAALQRALETGADIVPRLELGQYSSLSFSVVAPPLRLSLMDLDVETTEAIQVSVHILRDLLTLGVARGGMVDRGGGDSEILPRLPLAETNTHAIAATDAQVAEHYEDVEAFWSCWDAVEKIGEHRLATRAIDAVAPADFLDRVQDRHRAMARLAKPGQAAYYTVSVLSENERQVYLRGEARLHPVAYFEGEARADFSCVLGAGEHVPGWEIDGLDRWINDLHSLPDGSPLREVRVLFTHEAQARAERRPLLDIGARVFFLGSDGMLAEITM